VHPIQIEQRRFVGIDAVDRFSHARSPPRVVRERYALREGGRDDLTVYARPEPVAAAAGRDDGDGNG
jgi:hypothetical protein